MIRSMESLITTIRRIIVALAAAGALPAHAGMYSDIWYAPDEPGWGVSIVQQLETAFVTLYVYGPDGRPTWYVASRADVYAYSNPGGYPQFRGDLYKTEGTPFGAPYDSGRNRVDLAGEVSLEVLAKDRIRVHYTINGVSGVKEVRRYTFEQPIELANYISQFNLRQARNGAPFGTLYVQGDMLLHFSSETRQAFLRVDDQLGRRCEFRGPYELAGKLFRASGSYTCDKGDSLAGTFELTDIEVTANGVTGRIAMSGSDGLGQSGGFAGLRW